MININNWIDVPGHEGKYQISISENSIKSLSRKLPGKFGGIITERILKPWFTSSGHFMFGLSKNGITKTVGIHNIVMLIKEGPCPEGMEVCHNDGNPTNNHPDNLRYDTHSANGKDAYRHGKKIQSIMLGKFGKDNHLSKKVIGGLIEFESIREAERITGIDNSTISRCCRGKQKTAGGIVWKYL